MNKGRWYAVGAYTLWGLLPVYWKWLGAVPVPQVFCHRIFWSFVTLGGIILVSRQGRAFWETASQGRVLGHYIPGALLIGINWLLYIWAVNAGFIVETSLGYFINPLISVVLGVVFLKERLRRGQWAAVMLAAVGVIYLTYVYGTLPWIALVLAFTFGLYGLVKKTAPLGSLFGLTLETAALVIPAVAFLLYTETVDRGAFLHAGVFSDLLLVCAGFITAAPLLLFSAAARRIPLSLMGILQYIAPSLQFFLGVWVYQEHFTSGKLIGFVFVWVALAVYGLESYWVSQRRMR